MKFYRKMTYPEKIKLFTKLKDDCFKKLNKAKKKKSIEALNNVIDYYSACISDLKQDHTLFSNYYTFSKPQNKRKELR